MKRMLVISMALIMGVANAAASTASSKDHVQISRHERCSLLDRQLTRALNSKHAEGHAGTARTLRRKARHFCASRREAQGIRSYADALKLLGIVPIDSVRTRPHKPIQSKEKRK